MMIDPALRAELEQPTEQKEEFKIENIEQATWAFRKLKAFDEADEDIKRSAEYDIERTKQWEQKELQVNEDSRNYFRKILIDYYAERSANDPKFELKTPYGYVKSYKGRKTWSYQDDVLISSLKNAGADEFIKTKETVNKAELKKSATVVDGKVVTPDGVVLNGVAVEQQPDHVDVRLSKEIGGINRG